MKNSINRIFAVFLLMVMLSSCSKGGSDTPPPVQEEANLVIGLNPEPPAGISQTLSSEYKFTVVVSSAMPAQGVDIKVDYVKDSGGSVFSQTISSSSTTNNITITSIPFNEVGTVTVVISSKTKPTNTVTKSFKLVRK